MSSKMADIYMWQEVCNLSPELHVAHVCHVSITWLGGVAICLSRVNHLAMGMVICMSRVNHVTWDVVICMSHVNHVAGGVVTFITCRPFGWGRGHMSTLMSICVRDLQGSWMPQTAFGQWTAVAEVGTAPPTINLHASTHQCAGLICHHNQ